MSDTVIRVRGLSKQYTIGAAKRSGRTLSETIQNLFRRAPEDAAAKSSFWALKDVDFDIRRGEVVGIIGRNGAGKSTLLKVLSRITDPTEGEIDITGRVGSLLEVGTGFHPELTGRENIYLNGAILGMRRAEITAKFDEIVAFAETEKFLDTPVKHYSSGMYTRLAFAVAAHLEPEILIVDEVLAVGDAEFQRKCMGKMQDVAGEGRTVIFVSHNMTAVAQLCSTAILMKSGRVGLIGDLDRVIQRYTEGDNGGGRSVWTRTEEVYSNEYVRAERLAIVDETGNPVDGPLRNDARYWVEIDVDIQRVHSLLEIGYGVMTSDAALLYWSFHTDGSPESWPVLQPGLVRLRSPWPHRLLNEGTYRVELLAAMHQQSWLIESGKNAPGIAVEVLGGLSDSPHFNHKRYGMIAPVLNWSVAEAHQ